MTFLHPILAGIGLAAVSLPILIHILMRRRRRPVRWGAMKFLLAAIRRQRRRLQFEQWLLLLSRCLVVALAALGIGGLVLGAGLDARANRPVALVIVLDDSLTSGAMDPLTGETGLARQVRAARALVASLSSARGDRVGIVAAGAPARPLLMPPTADLASVERVLAQVAPTDAIADWPGAATLLRDDAAEARRVVALLSGWREGSLVSASGLGALEGVETLLLSPPETASMDNASIASIEPLRSVVIASGVLGQESAASGGLDQVRILVRRSGPWVDAPAEASVRLAVQRADRRIALGDSRATFARGVAEAWVTISADLSALASGEGVLLAEIDADGLPADDTARFAIELQQSLRVGLVARGSAMAARTIEDFTPAEWIRLALSPELSAATEREIEVSMLDPRAVDRSRMFSLDAVLVAEPLRVPPDAWVRLAEFASNGGLVVIFPQADERVQRWSDAAESALNVPWKLEREATDASVGLLSEVGRSAPNLLAAVEGELAELIRPVRVERLLVSEAQSGVVLRMDNGAPLLLASRPGASRRGLIVQFTVAMDLDWSTLPVKPFMIPLMQEVVRQGIGIARGDWSAVAGSTPLAPPGAVELRAIAGKGSALRVNPDRLVSEPVRHAGAWRAVDAQGVTVGLVVVEPDRRGSATQAIPAERVIETFASLGVPPRVLDAPASPGEEASPEFALAPPEPRSSLGLLMLAAALAAALLETVLARRVSYAAVTQEVEA